MEARIDDRPPVTTLPVHSGLRSSLPPQGESSTANRPSRAHLRQPRARTNRGAALSRANSIGRDGSTPRGRYPDVPPRRTAVVAAQLPISGWTAGQPIHLSAERPALLSSPGVSLGQIGRA